MRNSTSTGQKCSNIAFELFSAQRTRIQIRSTFRTTTKMTARKHDNRHSSWHAHNTQIDFGLGGRRVCCDGHTRVWAEKTKM